jgi:hypothetical protein
MHPEMRNLFLVLVASALTPNLSCLAQTPFTQDAYIRFERDGYRGNVYLNEDGTYVIVQTGPDHATRSFGGKWRRHGESGSASNRSVTRQANVSRRCRQPSTKK